ncbi:unnamed protein product [Linum tenue]|uniref:Uncharacterized protein n=1 Tax=Linum tenue TaxID=586396 RepID=A0AAV0K6W1_9ROSI|nr:unnamed protein product [Linum tenue]
MKIRTLPRYQLRSPKLGKRLSWNVSPAWSLQSGCWA